MDTIHAQQTVNFCKAKLNLPTCSIGCDEADRVPKFHSSDFANVYSGFSCKDQSQPNLTCLIIDEHLTETAQKPKYGSSKEKHVSWATDNESEEECLHLISAIRKEKCFLQEPALQAVKFMVADHSNTLTELATIYLHLKLGRYPKTFEIMDYLDSEESLTEMDVMKSIRKFSEPLKSLLALFHGSASDSVSEQNKRDSLELTPSTQDCLLTTSISTTLTNEEELVSNLKSLTIEEQNYILKLEALKKEQTYLKNSLTCVKCRSRQIDTMLLPCGHVVLCSVCSENCYICPVCNKTALAEVKTYLS
ncbi:hypothetical protein Btru_049510 [Bulinus truncatus]|nr:hypothetical protein Btru_049510 [Bulinus truncatus]